MSSLQNKMYNHEVTPPENAWKKIADTLDESLIQHKFSSKLYNAAINPPVNTWEKISAGLNEAQLQNEFPTRLYNMEIAPPATTWQKISDSIEPKTETLTPVRSLKPLLRYAAAAVLIAAVAYSIIKLTLNTGGNENNARMANVVNDTPKAEVTKPAEMGRATTLENVLNENRNDVSQPTNTSKSKSGRPVKRTSRVISSSAVQRENDTELSQSIYAYADHVPDIADRYVMLMTPDGNIIRMSKKWSDLLCCVSGEEQDSDCKDQLKKWQEKIASSSLAPSPGNFMDILGLVNSLDDNNGL